MKVCGKLVTWGLIAGLAGWAIFIATLTYAAFFVPDVAAHADMMFTRRSGLQAGGFIAGAWLAIAGLALCVTGYFKEFAGINCLLAVVPAALYVANPWSWLIFIKFIGS